MLTLIFFSCLLNGTDCRAHVISAGFNTPTACFTAGLMQFAPQWTSEHPERSLKGQACTNVPEVFFQGKEI